MNEMHTSTVIKIMSGCWNLRRTEIIYQEVSGLLSLDGGSSLPPPELMKLRFPFRLQQLLSAAAGALFLTAGALAQDVITPAAGAPMTGKVLGVTPSGQLEIQLAGTTDKIGIALNQIREVRMNP